MMNFLKEVKYAHDNIKGMNWWQAFRLVWELHTNPIILAEEEEENED